MGFAVDKSNPAEGNVFGSPLVLRLWHIKELRKCLVSGRRSEVGGLHMLLPNTNRVAVIGKPSEENLVKICLLWLHF